MPSRDSLTQPYQNDFQNVTEILKKNDRSRTIVFIDSSVENYQHLIQGVNLETEVIVLNGNEDGISQITRTLQERDEIESVHLVCHGAPGCLFLGKSQLNLNTLDSYAFELKSWFASFSKHHRKSLLLYGCQVAAGEEGAEFLSRLYQLTGAMIAASANLTGNSRLGGDWNLEIETGDGDVAIAFSPTVRESYAGVLATFVVNTLEDENNGLNNGQISLREALNAANNTAGADIIEFDSSLSGGTITLIDGELQITDAVTIEGLGADNLTLSGNNSSRVFNVNDTNDNTEIEAAIDGLTITGGSVGWEGGGGIVNQENLTVTNSIVSGNIVYFDNGGGIFNVGTLTVNNSIVSSNRVIGDIENGYQFGGDGGGIFNTGDLTVTNSTISGNDASYQGDGIINSHNLTVTNSTISGNLGSGIDNSGELSLINGTVTNNEIGIVSFGNATIGNSIISGNLNADINGTPNNVSSQGNNLIGTGNAISSFNQPSDVTGVTDPRLEALADNGGFTQTHALKPDSPAINSGNNALLPADTADLDFDGNTSEPTPVDQRGESRVRGGTVDLGAFESSFTFIPLPDINLTTDAEIAFEGEQSIVYRLYRTGNLDAPLEVQLTATGSMGLTTNDFNISGVNGTFPNYTVTIPAGVREVKLTLSALEDQALEVGESLILSLAENASYQIDSVNNSSTITIFDRTLLVNNTNDSGIGSLRQAILDANAATGANTIVFDESLAGKTIALTSGELSITDTLTIDGLGADKLTVSGNNSSRVFSIKHIVEIEGLTITDGNSADGGGIYNQGNLTLKNSIISGNLADSGNGGGISNEGTLTITSSIISGNLADSGNGGGISNRGTLTVNNSIISGNQAKGYLVSPDGYQRYEIAGDGGGIDNFDFGTLTVTNSTISSNEASYQGDGILNTSNITVTNSTISGNLGSGIEHSGSGELSLVNATVTNNEIGIVSSGMATIGNSIISGNLDADVSGTTNNFSSQGNNLIGTGNAISSFNQISDVTSVTDPRLEALADNGRFTPTHALKPDSPAINFGNNALLPADTADLDSDGNTSEPLPVDQRGEPRIQGGIVDIGAFESDFTFIPLPAVSLTTNTEIALEGEQSVVYRLFRTGSLEESLEIPLTATGSIGLTTDDFNISGVNGTFPNYTVTIPAGVREVQLTLSAVEDRTLEAGESLTLSLSENAAYRIDSVNNSSTVTIFNRVLFVNNTNDSGIGSLRQAILDANAIAGAKTIVFDESLTGKTITLTSGELSITEALTLDGLGADKLTVSGNNNSRVFSISRDDIVEIEGLTITEGNSSEGGGIFNEGKLTLKNSIISGNTANTGGGIVNRGDAVFVATSSYSGYFRTYESFLTVIDSTISGNTASTGGGISNRFGDATITNSIISNNTANSGSGGGVFSVAFTTTEVRSGENFIALGDLEVNNTTISNNTASASGGGIFNNESDLNVSNSIISGNTAGDDGGGIIGFGYVVGVGYSYKSGDINISNSTIANNTAEGDGGGIASNLDALNLLTITSSTISGNTAGSDGGGIRNIGINIGDGFGAMAISDSTISDNVANEDGGGIFSNSSTRLSVNASIISGNTAGSDGGGLYTKGGTANNFYLRTEVINSTISGNVADEKGGGIFNNSYDTKILQNTITANTASSNGGGGVFTNNKATVGNTIIAANTDNNDIGGNAFDSQGFNLIGNGDGASGFGVTGDLVGTSTNPIDPLLGPLQDNGGPTETHALLPDSPAINAGNNDLLNNSFLEITTDQRGEGFPRVINEIVDIGSFEFSRVPIVSLTTITALAFEDGQNAVYRLSRTGTLNNPLEIQLTALASTGLNLDEFGLNGVTGTFPNFTITIPAGERFIDFSLTAVEDFVSDAYETLTLNLVDDTAYQNDSNAASAIATILDASAFTVTNTNDSGVGSLRQAILNANAIAGENTITFDASLNRQSITLTSGSLNITDALIIDGLGANNLTVSGNNSSTVFVVDDNNYSNNIKVEIEGLKITEGKAYWGGGIWNTETLTLTDSIISGNTADERGGGIYNSGNLVVTKSVISGNTAATYSGGGIENNRGTVRVSNSTISNNRATQFGDGGGINNSRGTVTVIDSTISGNTAVNSGGGIDSYGNLTVIDSTIGGNTSSSGGGITNSGDLTIINSTISGNTANVSSGGGIENAGNLTLTNSTISGNTAVYDGGGISNRAGSQLTIANSTITLNQAQSGQGSGIVSVGSETIQVSNSIISGNLNSDVDVIYGYGDPDTFTSGGYNLIGTGNAVDDFNAEGDITGIIDPRLGPLQDNGGPTETHALLPDSPAIDTGSNDLIPADTLDLDGDGNTSEPLPFDQRGEGFPRIINEIVDIGAYEASASSLPVITIAASGDPSEAGSIPGTFTISRGTNTSGDLVVTLNLGGTASLGSDYTVNFTNGTVTIPDGQNNVNIPIAPINDRVVDGNETVVLTIAPDDTYQLGSANTASLTIVDNDFNVIKGTPQSDTLTGTDYNDSIDGGALSDRLNGLAGDDIYIVDSIRDVVVELPSQGIDTVKSSANYTLTANVENLILTGKSNLNGTGNDLDNLIQGNRDDNILKGLAGNDTLLGSAGNDILIGGAGNDTLTGGRGSDRFLFGSGAVFTDSAFGVDVLSDFSKRTDNIALSKTSFTALTSTIDSNLQASDFATINTDGTNEASLASSSSAKIVYNLGTGNLLYNQNGVNDGLGNGGLFATLTGIPVLDENNFSVQS